MSFRKLRLRSVWLLILPFFYFSSPTPGRMGVGVALSALGLMIRAWAAGTIQKNQFLTTGGPYSYTRNPLYLGTLFLGFGVVAAGGVLWFAALFAGFYGLIYGVTMRQERARLEDHFGDSYREYAESVPALIPRLSPYRSPAQSETQFSIERFLKNREWEAFLGTASGFGMLVAKMIWMA